jgi:aerobic-type carbon monoxide dehydrogenase small subunit (CoxS/CutS family)
MYMTALKPDELLVEVRVPPLPAGFGSAYLRVHRFQRPTLGVAVAAWLQNGRIEGTRLAVGCVGPRPERLTELENKLEGTTLGDAQRVIRESRSYLRQLLQPVEDLLGSADYKSYATCVLLGRALEQAVQNNRNKDKGGRTKDVGFESRRSSFELKPESSKPKLETLRTFDLSLTINGKPWNGLVPVEETLLEFIRNRLGLTGTKRSCESEVCGACTVLVNNQAVSSCNYLAFEAHGRTVLTIEGLADGEKLDPLQEAFIRNVGAQCGYCTPGQIMAAKALLLENPAPTREQIVDWLSGNICRCGAYPAIVTSILEASRESQKH